MDVHPVKTSKLIEGYILSSSSLGLAGPKMRSEQDVIGSLTPQALLCPPPHLSEKVRGKEERPALALICGRHLKLTLSWDIFLGSLGSPIAGNLSSTFSSVWAHAFAHRCGFLPLPLGILRCISILECTIFPKHSPFVL